LPENRRFQFACFLSRHNWEVRWKYRMKPNNLVFL
jgi:hypothetical protein